MELDAPPVEQPRHVSPGSRLLVRELPSTAPSSVSEPSYLEMREDASELPSDEGTPLNIYELA